MTTEQTERRIIHYSESDFERISHQVKTVENKINEIITLVKTLNVGVFTQELYDRSFGQHNIHIFQNEYIAHQQARINEIGLTGIKFDEKLTLFSSVQSIFNAMVTYSLRVGPLSSSEIFYIPLEEFRIKDERAYFPSESLESLKDTYCTVFLKDKYEEVYSSIEQIKNLYNKAKSDALAIGRPDFYFRSLFDFNEKGEMVINYRFFK